MRKVTSWEFRKCCSFWVLKVLNPSYWLSKLGENLRKNSEERRCQKKKTRPQFWVLGAAIESAWAQHGWFHADSMAAVKTHYCGRLIFFYTALFLVTDPKFHSPSTLSSDNSRSKTPRPKNYHIFGKLWTWGFTWWYPGYVFQYQNLK